MIYIASDSHGFLVISFVKEYLSSKSIIFENLGVQSLDADISLEVMLPIVANKVREEPEHKAIISCGTGIGGEVVINKFSGIRATLATSPRLAEWSVVYDKCNVLCLVGWETTKEDVFSMLHAWFSAVYDGSEKRIRMMDAFNTWH